jgi:dTMP kinase
MPRFACAPFAVAQPSRYHPGMSPLGSLKPNSPGILIAFDGIDGAGKTTQVDLLRHALAAAGLSVVASKEPTSGPWGRRLRESAQTGRLSLADELHAFVEDRKQHVAELIAPALARGDVVILDRYYFSTIAYQGSRGADVAAIERENKQIAPRPDATFFLDLSAEAAMDRIAITRGDTPNHFERVDSLRAIREIFLALAAGDPQIHILDARQTIDQIFSQVAGAVGDLLTARRPGISLALPQISPVSARQGED